MGERAGSPPVGDAPRPPRRADLWSSSDRRWDRIRHTLLAGWLILVVAVVVTGARPASWDDVQALVAAGEVDSVRVVGELPTGGTGYSLTEVHWRSGPLRYVAEVVHFRGGGGRPRLETATGGAMPVVRERPTVRLTALQPGLQVTYDRQPTSGATLLGWQVPSPVGFSAVLLFAVGLALLVAGPQPWRATRWAWFWLSTAPGGGIAFLLLSGPTAGLPGPRKPHHRLTGGWAFLLSIPLMSVLGPYR